MALHGVDGLRGLLGPAAHAQADDAGVDMRLRDFMESMATVDSRHRRSNEENSMTPDSQKQKLA